MRIPPNPLLQHCCQVMQRKKLEQQKKNHNRIHHSCKQTKQSFNSPQLVMKAVKHAAPFIMTEGALVAALVKLGKIKFQ